MFKKFLMLSGVVFNFTNAVFPTAKSLCENHQFSINGVMQDAKKFIAEAALIHAYGDPYDLSVMPNWTMKRFACHWTHRGSDKYHAGNFVAFRKETGTNEKVAIIAFKGTEGGDDWINDFEIDLHPAREALDGYNSEELGLFFAKSRQAVRLHRGFNKMILSSQKKIFAIFDELIGSDKTGVKFILTGHSMGGALATIFAGALFEYLGLANNSDNRISVISFGAPKFCNDYAAHLMNVYLNPRQSIVRVINSNSWGRDRVADVPPSWSWLQSKESHFTHLDTLRLALEQTDKGHEATLYFANFLETDPNKCKRVW